MSKIHEKHSATIAEASEGIRQLKLGIEQNAMILAQYKTEFQTRVPVVPEKHDIDQLRKILLFIADVPANVLRRLSKYLRLLTRRLLLTIHQATWRLPRSLIGDVIRFEDALGRKCKLPYQYFKHWAIFQPYLVHIFDGLPGGYQVQRNQYRLTAGQVGRLVNHKSWGSLIRPGEYLSMAVVSTLPFETKRRPKCPSCHLVSSEEESSAGRVICKRCYSPYQLSQESSRYLVTPSDGDNNQLSMMTQKNVALSPDNNTCFGSHHNDENKIHNEAFVDIDSQNCLNLSQANIGVSQLKNVLLHSTNDPTEIANAVEALLDQLLTASQDPNLIDDLQVFRLRTARALICNEASRRTSLNYFDFKQEHSRFMFFSLGVFKCLEHKLDELKDGNIQTSDMRSWIAPYSNWVLDHYHQLYSPLDNKAHSNYILILTKTLVGSIHCYRVPSSLTIQQLKELIQNREGLPTLQQYLVYKGRKLEDQYTVAHYDMGPKYYIHILLPIWRARAF